ncbi:hypothetical protein J4Q44_G00374060, partial [Coregonus suidteri]
VLVLWRSAEGLVLVLWRSAEGLVLVLWRSAEGLVLVLWMSAEGLVLVLWRSAEGLVLGATGGLGGGQGIGGVPSVCPAWRSGLRGSEGGFLGSRGRGAGTGTIGLRVETGARTGALEVVSLGLGWAVVVSTVKFTAIAT